MKLYSLDVPSMGIFQASVLLLAMLFASTNHASDHQRALKVWDEKIPGGYRILVRSKDAIPRSLQIKFKALRNLTANVSLPLQVVLQEKTEALVLMELKVTNPKDSTRYSYHFDWTLGDHRLANHDDSVSYILPYEHGTKRQIDQGYFGKFSHSEAGNEHAIDIPMPEGTNIIAARDGVVLKIKEDSSRGGASKSYQRDGNKIVVLHEDGSYAEYVHLQKDGALVELGDSVLAGQLIGLSGNTGRTTGPHLHFQVSIPTNRGLVKSVPTTFYNHLGEVGPVSTGVSYYAFHPDKPAFATTFGSAITNDAYDNYQQSIPENNKISDRAEKTDGTTVLFVRNGYPVAKKIEITMPRLENLTASKETPLSMIVEPLTERFVLFVREKQTGTPHRYRMSWRYTDARDSRENSLTTRLDYGSETTQLPRRDN